MSTTTPDPATTQDATAPPGFGEATIDDCDAEPIHVPGSVQPHAAVAVVVDGVVVQHSTNLGDVLRLDDPSPEAIDGRRLDDLLGADAALLASVIEPERRRDRVVTRIEREGEEIDMSCPVSGDVSILQFEPVAGSDLPDGSFRDTVTEAVTLVQGAASSQEVVELVCGFIRRLTGFDRVMAYRFEPDEHGVVVAEDHVEGLEPFLDLHYPATDIPAQARRMYLDHWIRLIPDASYEPVPIVPTLTPTNGEPLDLSDVDARSVSPIHCEYLRNMGVASSMSISIVVDGRLWGLFACHHYSGPRRPPRQIREACEFVALTASVMIGSRESLERAEGRLHVEGLIRQVERHLAGRDDVVSGLRAADGVLSDLVDAGGVSIVLGGRVESVGACPTDAAAVAIAQACADRSPNEVVATDRVVDLLTDDGSDADDDAGNAGDASSGSTASATNASGPDGTAGGTVTDDDLEVSAGVVALPLSSAQGNYLLFHRPRWEREVRWAGRPEKAVRTADDGSSRLVPRSSFEAWVEDVHDRSRPWRERDLEAVEALRVLLATHITRTIEQMAQLNTELSRSNAELDAFAYVAAHDLKEPLRGIANYASFLLEDYEDLIGDEGGTYLRSMASLTTRMTSLLGSLLDYARIGQSELHRSTVTIRDLVEDVRPLVSSRLHDSNGEMVIVGDPGDVVSADRDLIGQVLMNLITNALKYNASERPRIEIGTTTLDGTQRGLAIVQDALVSDRRRRVVFVRDDGIGIAPAMLEDVFRVFRRLHAPTEYGGGAGAGLTIARRIVTRHGGAIWAESTPGEGSTFFFTTEGGDS